MLRLQYPSKMKFVKIAFSFLILKLCKCRWMFEERAIKMMGRRSGLYATQGAMITQLLHLHVQGSPVKKNFVAN
jgi:hypothetical protein